MEKKETMYEKTVREMNEKHSKNSKYSKPWYKTVFGIFFIILFPIIGIPLLIITLVLRRKTKYSEYENLETVEKPNTPAQLTSDYIMDEFYSFDDVDYLDDFDDFDDMDGAYDMELNERYTLFDIENKSTNYINLKNLFNIPDEIFNMLWIKNGEFANYKFKNSFEHNVNGIRISISSTMDEEPSLIYTNLPISNSLKTDPMKKIGYFPSYKHLLPEERYVYLKWLENPFNNLNVDIGYVFIFYYGLERHLFLGESEKAFELIYKLNKAYKNSKSSFYYYSIDALLSYLLYSKDTKRINKFLLENEIPNTTVGILVKFTKGDGLYSKDIISLASEVGFKNKRYIKSEPKLFETILEEKIREYNGNIKISLEDFKNEIFPPINMPPMANISLRQREFVIPNIIENYKIKNLFYNLLQETHDEVKSTLKEQRKRNN